MKTGLIASGPGRYDKMVVDKTLEHCHELKIRYR